MGTGLFWMLFFLGGRGWLAFTEMIQAYPSITKLDKSEMVVEDYPFPPQRTPPLEISPY